MEIEQPNETPLDPAAKTKKEEKAGKAGSPGKQGKAYEGQAQNEQTAANNTYEVPEKKRLYNHIDL